MGPKRFTFAPLSILLAAVFASSATAGTKPVVQRVSVGSHNTQATGASTSASLSADGRYLAFTSTAHDLVPGDTNNFADIFVKDLMTGAVERISLAEGGGQADGTSSRPSISADGHYVAFESDARNLISTDNNSVVDIFIRDRWTGVTTRASQTFTGQENNYASSYPSISADGRWIAFRARSSYFPFSSPSYERIFIHDRVTGVLEAIHESSSSISFFEPRISASGQRVAFRANGSNLPSTSYSSSSYYPYVHDRQTGEFFRASNYGSSLDAQAISADGLKMVFADSLISTGEFGQVFSFDPALLTNKELAKSTLGFFPASASVGGVAISSHGRYVAFATTATGLTDDVFDSKYDIFLADQETGVLSHVSVDSTGFDADEDCKAPAISADGRTIIFETRAALDPLDTNNDWDLYRIELGPVAGALSIKDPIAGGLSTIELTGAAPLTHYVTGISLSGQGPIGSPFGLIELSPPYMFFDLISDPTGSASLPLAIPIEMLGFPLWAQAVDMNAGETTSVFFSYIL